VGDDGGKPSMSMFRAEHVMLSLHASPEHYWLSDVGYKYQAAMKSYESIVPYRQRALADYGRDQIQPLARLSLSSPYLQLGLSSEAVEEAVLGPRKKIVRRCLFSRLPDSSRGPQLAPF
jgi:hypothetical protein